MICYKVLQTQSKKLYSFNATRSNNHYKVRYIKNKFAVEKYKKYGLFTFVSLAIARDFYNHFQKVSNWPLRIYEAEGENQLPPLSPSISYISSKYNHHTVLFEKVKILKRICP